MKLQTKLLFALLAGLLAVSLGSAWIQHSVSVRTFARFAAANDAGEESRQWRWVQRLHDATDAALRNAMEDGEMEKFDSILASQRNVSGLQELSQYDADGRCTHSTDVSRVKQNLRADLKQQVLAAGQTVKCRTAGSFEIYEPLRAKQSCLQCHGGWKEGQVCGAMTLRFSADALDAAEQSWTTFGNEFQKSNLVASGITLAVSIAVVSLLVLLILRFLMTAPLKRAAGELTGQFTQVAAAARQIGASSQTGAENASEQASSLEETSASLEEMSSMTARNAENASHVNVLARQTRDAADRGARDMQAMSAAMDAIKASSDDVAKIIRTIDEIAFQTNILALNAAVESARAGEAGMGFAVVADEVRALAQRSAQAAKETSAKIEGAIARTSQGVELSGKVAQALQEILAKARQVDELARQVAGASREQSQGIKQLNTAVSQMDRVTQANAANAGQSAAAAEELNAQAEAMHAAVSELLSLVNGAGENETVWRATSRHSTRKLQAQSATPASSHPNPSTTAESRGYLRWDPEKMATGVESVDKQHRELIEMINNLDTACRRGEAREHLKEMADFLADYAQRHFNHEEGLMDEVQCPARGKNKVAHKQFLAEFSKFQERFAREGASTSLVLELKNITSAWLANHICRVDSGLRSCAKVCASAPAGREFAR